MGYSFNVWMREMGRLQSTAQLSKYSAIQTHEDGQNYERENEMAKGPALIFRGQVEK